MEILFQTLFLIIPTEYREQNILKDFQSLRFPRREGFLAKQLNSNRVCLSLTREILSASRKSIYMEILFQTLSLIIPTEYREQNILKDFQSLRFPRREGFLAQQLNSNRVCLSLREKSSRHAGNPSFWKSFFKHCLTPIHTKYREQNKLKDFQPIRFPRREGFLAKQLNTPIHYRTRSHHILNTKCTKHTEPK